jgi:hypothetical protein
LEVEPEAWRVTQPFGTPGDRQSGAAFASVETLCVITIAATTVDRAQASHSSKRIV